MQDHRHRLRGNKKGVLGLPIKLLLIMAILAVTIPIVTQAMGESQGNIAEAEMHHESMKFKNAATLAHFSGNGCSRTVDIELPAGCELQIGGSGENAYCIRSVYNGEIVSKEYFEQPAFRIDDEMIITGKVSLKLTNIETGNIPEIEVTVL